MKEEFFVVILLFMWIFGLILSSVFLIPMYKCVDQLKTKVSDNGVTVCVNITDGLVYDQILIKHPYSNKVTAIVLMSLAFFMTIVYVCVNYFKHNRGKIHSNDSIQVV